MRRKLLGILCALLLCLVQATYAQAQKTPQRPSLDALRERSEAYWSLLAKRQKLEAASFVQRASRQNFITRQEPDFSEPRISKMEFSTDRREATVTIVIKRKLPLIQHALDWSVQEKWIYRDGEWYVEIPKPMTILGIVPTAGTGAGPNSEALEKKGADFRKRLEFHSTELEFGTIRKGTTATVPLQYVYRGSTPLQFALQDAPSSLSVLSPGTDKTATDATGVRLALRTGNMEGEVNLLVKLIIREAETDLPFELKLHGFVYTPVSFSPSTLRFAKGESEKEIVVRNNTKTEIRLASFSSRSTELQVPDVPRSLQPGEECKLKIVQTAQAPRVNTSEELNIRFPQPVEGLASLRIFVTRNYVQQAEAPKPKIPPRKSVEEMMRKARPEQPTKP